MLPIGLLGLLNPETLISCWTRNSVKALLGTLVQQGSAKASNSFPWWLNPEGWWTCSFYSVKVGICPGVGPQGWLRCFAHPFGMLCAGSMHIFFCFRIPAFAPCSLEMAVEIFWSFCVFCQKFALTAIAHSYFYSLLVFLYFGALGDIWTRASIAASQQRVPVPSLSQFHCQIELHL